MSEEKTVDRNGTTSLISMIVLALALSIGLTVAASLAFGFENLNAPVDASIVNGMLTATAIIFAFVTFEAREIEPFKARFIFLVVLVTFLMTTGVYYFSQVLDPNVGHPTKSMLAVATANFYFNVLSSINAMCGRKSTAKKDSSQVERGI
jgi:hypothetical protein